MGLAFERESGKRTVVWVANADGSGAKMLSTASGAPKLSPDGRRLLYYTPNADEETDDLYVHDFRADKATIIGPALKAVWSPNGNELAVADPKTLSFVDLETGERRELVRGDVGGWSWGFSFSPDGKWVAYVLGEANLNGTDEYRADVFAVRVSDGKTTRLTYDGKSDRPVWGKDWIAYRHHRVIDGFIPVGELWLMRPDGTEQHLLARGPENTAAHEYGVEPLEFSDDGERLLAREPRDISLMPVVFSVPGGERRRLSVKGKPDTFAEAFARDGSEVLVHAGGISDSYNLYAVPSEGGPARLLADDVSGWGSWAR